MWYEIVDILLYPVLLNVPFALWIFIDAKKRMNHVLGWPLATLLLGPIILLPIYLAKRNLKTEEVRSGGTGWNILRYFAALWTIVIAVSVIWHLSDSPDSAQQYTSEVEQAGATIGAVMALGMIFFIWLGVLVGALVLGLILKDSNIVEKGPTGPLANTE